MSSKLNELLETARRKALKASFVGSVSLSGSRSAGHDAVSNLAKVSDKSVASYTVASGVRR